MLREEWIRFCGSIEGSIIFRVGFRMEWLREVFLSGYF